MMLKPIRILLLLLLPQRARAQIFPFNVISAIFCAIPIPIFHIFCNDCSGEPCGNGICTDTGFSYECECDSGYEFREGTCQNKNDCSAAPCLNGGTCVDLVDGYNCTCAPGFSGFTNCSVNIDDCASLPCGAGGMCVDGINEYTCQCDSGYILGEVDDVLTCRNVDDCLGDPCKNGTCFDGINDYTCECFNGFDYDGTTCKDQDECLGDPCNVDREVCENTVGSFLCTNCFLYDNIDGRCNCTAGFERHKEGYCSDIDECSSGENDCVTEAQCVDMPGDFRCDCPAGFGGDGKTSGTNCTLLTDCRDEPCLNGGICSDDGDMVTCDCTGTGFVGTVCQKDIDECLSADPPCINGAQCVNAPGTFSCDCTGTGFEGGDCSTDFNECTANNPCQNGATCDNLVGSYRCTCREGWVGQDCTFDIDECEEGTDSCDASKNEVCTNTDGSFRCDCSDGYNRDGGVDGVGGAGDCKDINECELDPIPCTEENRGTCTNSPPGSYTCECDNGYAKIGDGCVDVNECENELDDCDGSKNEFCTNTVGSFRCDCSDGYNREGGVNGVGGVGDCKDVNECELDPNPCTEENRGACTNSPPGSYTCECDNGYALITGDGCIDVNECENKLDDCDDATELCVNTIGGYKCDPKTTTGSTNTTGR